MFPSMWSTFCWLGCDGWLVGWMILIQGARLRYPGTQPYTVETFTFQTIPVQLPRDALKVVLVPRARLFPGDQL